MSLRTNTDVSTPCRAGRRSAAYGLRPTAYGLRFAVYGLRCAVCDSRLTAHGSWFIIMNRVSRAAGTRDQRQGTRNQELTTRPVGATAGETPSARRAENPHHVLAGCLRRCLGGNVWPHSRQVMRILRLPTRPVEQGHACLSTWRWSEPHFGHLTSSSLMVTDSNGN